MLTKSLTCQGGNKGYALSIDLVAETKTKFFCLKANA